MMGVVGHDGLRSFTTACITIPACSCWIAPSSVPLELTQIETISGRFGGERSDVIRRTGSAVSDDSERESWICKANYMQSRSKAEGLASLRTRGKREKPFRESVRFPVGLFERSRKRPCCERSNVNCARGTEGPQTPMRKRSVSAANQTGSRQSCGLRAVHRHARKAFPLWGPGQRNNRLRLRP